MTNERKDELGSKFLLQNITDITAFNNELMKLEIQDLIYLISSAKYFRDKEAAVMEDFDNKITIYYKAVIEKIKSSQHIYITYNKETGYPHIDDNGRIWLFSKLDYASEAEDYYMQQQIMLETKTYNNEEIIHIFALMYEWGMENILVDNGQYAVEIARADILAAPDWSNTPQISIPVMNPEVQYSMIQFFQNVYMKGDYDGKKEFLHILEGKMLDKIVGGKYLVAMKLSEDSQTQPDENGRMTIESESTLQFANITDQNDNTEWVPAFTDWDEFRKAYNQDEWKGNITTYDDLVALSDKNSGFVINPYGMSVRINKKNIENIASYRKEEASEK